MRIFSSISMVEFGMLLRDSLSNKEIVAFGTYQQQIGLTQIKPEIPC
jgi:hypothetical protein